MAVLGEAYWKTNSLDRIGDTSSYKQTILKLTKQKLRSKHLVHTFTWILSLLVCLCFVCRRSGPFIAGIWYTKSVSGGGGGTPLQEANGDVPLDGIAFSRLEWL